MEEYSEVAKMLRRVYSHTYGGQKCSEEFIVTLMEGKNDSLEVFLSGRALLRYSNTMETLPMKKQKLDRKKLYRTWIKQHKGYSR